MKKFYTYIYLDPRKPGNYVYGDYSFEYEPIYVGKGNADRYKRHLNQIYDPRNECIFFYRKIRKILEENLDPIILKVEENLTEQKAFNLEIWLIWAIGRIDKGIGTLTNLTDGGHGGTGWIRTKEWKEKCSIWMKGRPSAMKGKIMSDISRQKMSLAKKGKPSCRVGKTFTIEQRKQMSESHKGNIPWNKGKSGIYSPETIEKMKKPKSLESIEKMKQTKNKHKEI